MVNALRTEFMASTGYAVQTVATYLHSGWPDANIAAVFFFQRRFMMRFTLPGGLKVEFAPHGDDPDTWMSVLA